MHISIPLAEQATFEFETEHSVIVCQSKLPSANDWRNGLRESLQHPLGYPALHDSVLPSDVVTLTLDPQLPNATSIATVVVEALLEIGVPLENIQLVVKATQLATLQQAWQQQTPLAWHTGLRWIAHDPTASDNHAYVAALKNSLPVYVQRAITEADVFIPIALATPHTEHYLKPWGNSWYPAFSNAETQTRYALLEKGTWEQHARKRREETEEANWLVGNVFSILAVPAAAGELHTVLCGAAPAITNAIEKMYCDQWKRDLPDNVDLILAVFDHAPAQQTWRQLAQVLQQAATCLKTGGTVACWTALTSLSGMHADAYALHTIQEQLSQLRVVLHSQLPTRKVEELGFGVLQSTEQLTRLFQQHASVAILPSAQYAMLTGE